MKTIPTVHKLLFFKATGLYTLDTKIWKIILSSYESKQNIWKCRQLKYYQLRLRSEIGILLEIVLNAFKRLTVWLSIQTFISAIAPLSFISIKILCELAMLSDVDILLSPQKEIVHCCSCGDRCTHLDPHSSKRLNLLSVIILVCLGKTWKNKTCKINYFFIGPPSVDLWHLLMNWTHFINNFIKHPHYKDKKYNTNKGLSLVMLVILRQFLGFQ